MVVNSEQSKTMNPRDLMAYLDLTRLTDNDSVEAVEAFCRMAEKEYPNAAALCVYAEFIPLVKKILPKMLVATVVNFPQGQAIPQAIIAEIEWALTQGADEIDLVFPYHDFLANRHESVEKTLLVARQACGKTILKVILETGELKTPENIFAASQIAIASGADFLKTSTGKTAQGASLAAAETMLKAIKRSGKDVGLKVSGGVKTFEQARDYVGLCIGKMGGDWLSPRHFRIGASSIR